MDAIIYLYRLLGAAPLLLVFLAGLLLCVLRMRRDPAACALTGLAVLIMLHNRLVLPWIADWIFRTWLADVHELRWRILIDGAIFSLPEAIAWGLMLWAVFGKATRRREAAACRADS
jgi:hypothetical protein